MYREAVELQSPAVAPSLSRGAPWVSERKPLYAEGVIPYGASAILSAARNS
jgi:hypothetical protein